MAKTFDIVGDAAIVLFVIVKGAVLGGFVWNITIDPLRWGPGTAIGVAIAGAFLIGAYRLAASRSTEE
jgi:hypothetical protein